MPPSIEQSHPLAGRTIVVTRARAQAADFIAALEAYGARVVLCPTIEIAAPESYEALDEALENLYGYDWLIFTSTNGVDYFLRRFREKNHNTDELDDVRVCAIGEATAEKLVAAQVHVDVIPKESNAEGIFAALASYLGAPEAFGGLNFMIPRAAAGRDFLPRELERAGARADVIPVYRTVRPQQTNERTQLAALLVGGAIDCITFTSSSSVINFAQLFDAADLREALDEVTIACIGDVTARTIADHGLRCNITPAAANVSALAHAIADYYRATAFTSE